MQGVGFACRLLGGTSAHCRALGQKLLPEAWRVAIRVQEVFGSQDPKVMALTILSSQRALTDKDEWCGVLHAGAVVVTSLLCTSQQVIIKKPPQQQQYHPQGPIYFYWHELIPAEELKPNPAETSGNLFRLLQRQSAHWRKCWCSVIFITMSVKTCCQLTPFLTQYIFSKAEGK